MIIGSLALSPWSDFRWNLVGKRLEEIELKNGASLRDLLDTLSEKYGDPFKKEVYEPGLDDFKYGFTAVVNGVLMRRLQGLNTPLKDKDHVILMTFVSGG